MLRGRIKDDFRGREQRADHGGQAAHDANHYLWLDAAQFSKLKQITDLRQALAQSRVAERQPLSQHRLGTEGWSHCRQATGPPDLQPEPALEAKQAEEERDNEIHRLEQLTNQRH